MARRSHPVTPVGLTRLPPLRCRKHIANCVAMAFAMMELREPYEEVRSAYNKVFLDPVRQLPPMEEWRSWQGRPNWDHVFTRCVLRFRRAEGSTALSSAAGPTRADLVSRLFFRAPSLGSATSIMSCSPSVSANGVLPNETPEA